MTLHPFFRNGLTRASQLRRGRTMLAVLASAVVLSACSDPAPVAVPDLVGLSLDEAREAAGGFELVEMDASGDDRSVWSPANWSVQSQDPAAGTAVAPRSTLTVQLRNVRDEDEGAAGNGSEAVEEPPADGGQDEAPDGDPEHDPVADGQDPREEEQDEELIELVEQAFAWFTEERVSIDDDLELWMVQGSVDSITGYRPLGTFFIVETGLHRDNPDTERIAQGLCGVTSSALHGTGVSRVEVEASNGNRIARCNVLG